MKLNVVITVLIKALSHAVFIHYLFFLKQEYYIFNLKTNPLLKTIN